MNGLIMNGFTLIMFLLLFPDPIKMGTGDGDAEANNNIDEQIKNIYHAWCKSNQPEEKGNNKIVDEQIKEIYHDSCNCNDKVEDNNKIEFMLLKGISLKQLTSMKAKWWTFGCTDNFKVSKKNLEEYLWKLQYPTKKIASDENDRIQTKTGSEIFFEKMQEDLAIFNQSPGKEMRLKIVAELIGIINNYPDGLTEFNILQDSKSNSSTIKSGSVVIELVNILAQFFKAIEDDFRLNTFTSHHLTNPGSRNKRSGAIGDLSKNLSTLLHKKMKVGKKDANGNPDFCAPILDLVMKRIQMRSGWTVKLSKKISKEFTDLFNEYCKYQIG